MQHCGGQCDVDDVVRDVGALFVVAHQTAPAHEPTKGALDNPAPRFDCETYLSFHHAPDLDRKIHESRLIHQSPAVISRIAEQVFDPGPTLLQGIEYELGARRIGHIGRRQVHRQQSPVGVHSNVPLAAPDLLVGVVPGLLRRRCLHRLAVNDAFRRYYFAPTTHPIQHQRQVVNGLNSMWRIKRLNQ